MLRHRYHSPPLTYHINDCVDSDNGEHEFAELLEQKTKKDMMRERTMAESALTTARARSKKLFGLFEKLYEDNVDGKVTDEWFMLLSQSMKPSKRN